MKQVNTFYLHRSRDRELAKYTMKKDLDTTSYNGLDTLFNPNLLHEAGVFVCDVPQKFREKQYIEKDSVKILLSYLLCKDKMFLEPVLDTSNEIIKSIEIKHTYLSEIVEECLVLNRITTQKIQYILGSLSDLYTKKTIESTTRFYYKEEDQAIEALYPWRHLKKWLPKLLVYHLKEAYCTDTIFFVLILLLHMVIIIFNFQGYIK